MSEKPKDNKKYSVADIERYYNGKMSAQEMHALEKAALEDPFLADAMEGFIHTSTPSDDINNLKKQLQSRLGTSKVVALNERKNYRNLYKVAAMLIFVLGAGWIVYELAFNKAGTHISYSEKPESPESATSTDITTNQETSIKQETSIENPKEEQKNSRQEQQSTSISNDQSSKRKIPANTTNTTNKRSTPVLEQKNDLGKIQKTKEALADSFASDEMAQVATMAYGRLAAPATQKVEITSNANQVIISMNETQDGIKELVLKRAQNDSIRKKSPRIIIEEAEPEESWSKFGTYISENLPPELQTDTIEGTIAVSFDINSSGEPVNMHIEKSLCEKCDAQALRLLKEGPKWKRKTKRGKISFTF